MKISYETENVKISIETEKMKIFRETENIFEETKCFPKFCCPLSGVMLSLSVFM